MTEQRSNLNSPSRHPEVSHGLTDKHKTYSTLDTLNSFDEKHDDSQNWNFLHKVHETFDQQKFRKVRHSRRQKKKKKELESRSSQIKYKNTLDAMIFNNMCDKADHDCENETKEEAVKEGNRKSKRAFKLLRTNERDSKHNIGIDRHETCNKHCCLLPKQIKVESKNRFRCLVSKPVAFVERKEILSEATIDNACNDEVQAKDELISPTIQSLREREMFHNTFSFLIKLGSKDNDRFCQRQISQEETRWQNELKDLIWLELQAYRANMTPMAMDEYLCKKREAVGALLDEIMAYRFDAAISVNKSRDLNTSVDEFCIDAQLCGGCLSMYCQDCTRVQSEALEQVENLLTRLEDAEALYPSLQAFSVQYPLYKSLNFTGRIKAMCLWYNVTKHHRLQLVILGKLLILVNKKKKQDDYFPLDSSLSVSNTDAISSIDSKNSNSSNVTYYLPLKESLFKVSENNKLGCMEYYLAEFDRQTYRKYIEDVLKTRGLRKSLNFLEQLHTSVLRKARLALEKMEVPSERNIYFHEECDGDQEIQRYGMCSPEATSLNLPSFRAAFIFLSRVPLDVIHEFLRMRLDQKPEQPSPLSIRQLMRELREGLRIACVHRERFAEHSFTAAACDGPCTTLFDEDVKEFDESLKSVFNVYLDYLQQWVQMVQHDSFHKNLILDEWNFVKLIAKKIDNGTNTATYKFCQITKTMVEQINNFFIDGPQELRKNVSDEYTEEPIEKFYLISIGREWMTFFDEARDKLVKIVSLAKYLRTDIQIFPKYEDVLEELAATVMVSVMDLNNKIMEKIMEFQNNIEQFDEYKLENDYMIFRSRAREILHHAYRMGFEYYKELCKCILDDERCIIVKNLTTLAFLWMNFVRNYCERGRGLRPRWANHGLEFLILVCEPINTKYLTQEEFDQLKTSMDSCISHIIGSISESDTNSETDNFRKFHGSNRALSSPHCSSRTTSMSLLNDLAISSVSKDSRLKDSSLHFNEINASSSEIVNNICRYERVPVAVKKLDYLIDQKLKSRELIGQVIDRENIDKVEIKVRKVNFTWQRGIKIGQGRFGKVYTVVNNMNGELLAMKEIQLQPGDYTAILRVAEELRIFEGIQHKNLVRYYGVEIHREEMLIFMEFCAEGTLESLIIGSKNGLPESLLRKYTHQLLSAVFILHEHGIIHRDIKTANIFMTNEGDCLKLGDFGSAVKIKSHTTMPGELKGFVGTQAYMAPEVFMRNEADGHGRAVDIWSIGCCVIEMASGKRPWAEYDSNYQIMFKVGMGESPQPPKHLSVEGIEFVNKCLQHDPRKRPTVSALMTLTFAQSYEDMNSDLVL